MKHIFPRIILSLSLLLATGCVTQYDMVHMNGRVTTAKGKPKLVSTVEIPDESGKKRKVTVEPFYIYKDPAGQEQRISASRVHRIYPSSHRDDKDMYYLPNDYEKPESWGKSKPWYKRL